MAVPFWTQDSIWTDPRGHEDVSELTPKVNGLDATAYTLVEGRVFDHLPYTKIEVLDLLWANKNNVASPEDMIKVCVEAQLRSDDMNHAVTAISTLVDLALEWSPINEQALCFTSTLWETMQRQLEADRRRATAGRA